MSLAGLTTQLNALLWCWRVCGLTAALHCSQFVVVRRRAALCSCSRGQRPTLTNLLCPCSPCSFTRQGHHLNVNVLRREMLLDAMEHPENVSSRAGFL